MSELAELAKRRGVAALPGFLDSLRLLLDREQYSETDIAAMFDVSRERVRQLIERHGLQRPRAKGGLFMIRVWDDTEHRFKPVSRGQWSRERRVAGQVYRDAVRLKRDVRRSWMIKRLRALTERLGRDPTLAEMGRELAGTELPPFPSSKSNAQGPQWASYLVGLWGGPWKRSPRGHPLNAGKLAELRAAVGIKARGRGSAGHVREQSIVRGDHG